MSVGVRSASFLPTYVVFQCLPPSVVYWQSAHTQELPVSATLEASASRSLEATKTLRGSFGLTAMSTSAFEMDGLLLARARQVSFQFAMPQSSMYGVGGGGGGVVDV